MIEFQNVTKQYDDGTVAIEDISFEVEEGTTTVLVGPSGCGKTTTMKLVNRLIEPSQGTVYFDGTDISEKDEIELRRDIGYVIQEIGLFDHMTVADNVGTVPNLKGWDDDRIRERVRELLDLMDLPAAEYADQHPTELSGGQRQRVGVARALAADPDVMLMDEPFGALDPITREELQDEFLAIQDELDVTILFVTHSVEEALKMGDRIAIFDVGELVQYDTPQNVLENPKNDFVRDFIGQDRELKKLQVTPVRNVMCEANGKSVPDVEPITPSDTAQVALSRLLETDDDRLPVARDGEVVGVVEESDLRGTSDPTRRSV
ncbi:ABC transporter ATP-binding protein [Halorussus salinisoli]|uniref:ABC transporter ATP-binding protein n=1 Tax=Halorussus salinisoli TaxID=2558242 RepID=UPI0010C1CA91|nr:ABC transporter ATP-binding protein [Halorussus salinisoli]